MSEPIVAREARDTLEQCLRDHDRERAVGAVLGLVEDGLAIEDLYTFVLEPFLASVGHTWCEGRTAVWEEHVMAGAVRTAIDALYPRVLARKAAVEAVPVTVAFFCPPEENHDIGLRMLVDRFDLRGFRTVYVGAMTPVSEAVDCVRAVGAEVICLSASTHYQRAALSKVVETLRADLPGVRIAVGGPAFAHSEAGWQEYVIDSVDQLMNELAASAAVAGGEAEEVEGGRDA